MDHMKALTDNDTFWLTDQMKTSYNEEIQTSFVTCIFNILSIYSLALSYLPEWNRKSPA